MAGLRSDEPGGPSEAPVVIPFPGAAKRRKACVNSNSESPDARDAEAQSDADSRAAGTGRSPAGADSNEPGAAAHPIGAAAHRPDAAAGAPGASVGSGAGEGGGHAGALPPEHFWNLPNTVTVLRIAVVPVLLFIPLAQGVAGSRFMAWAFIIAALTDWLDGWLARRHDGRDVTRIGKLLDPLADKLIVSTALIMLLAIGRIPLWASSMVVVIVGRELAVTGLRGIASSHGQVVAAAGPGKIKTVAQSIATAALLFHYETLGLPAHEVGMIFLTIATGLTLWSGTLYFQDYFGWGRSG